MTITDMDLSLQIMTKSGHHLTSTYANLFKARFNENSRVTRYQSIIYSWYIYFCICAFTDGLVVCHLPFGPTAYFTLYNVVMRHDVPDIGTMSEAYPHLIFHNFTSQLGRRVSATLCVVRMPLIFYYNTCLCVQLISSTRAGVEYPQVSFSSAEGWQ